MTILCPHCNHKAISLKRYIRFCRGCGKWIGATASGPLPTTGDAQIKPGTCSEEMHLFDAAFALAAMQEEYGEKPEKVCNFCEACGKPMPTLADIPADMREEFGI